MSNFAHTRKSYRRSGMHISILPRMRKEPSILGNKPHYSLSCDALQIEKTLINITYYIVFNVSNIRERCLKQMCLLHPFDCLKRISNQSDQSLTTH